MRHYGLITLQYVIMLQYIAVSQCTKISNNTAIKITLPKKSACIRIEKCQTGKPYGNTMAMFFFISYRDVFSQLSSDCCSSGKFSKHAVSQWITFFIMLFLSVSVNHIFYHVVFQCINHDDPYNEIDCSISQMHRKSSAQSLSIQLWSSCQMIRIVSLRPKVWAEASRCICKMEQCSRFMDHHDCRIC